MAQPTTSPPPSSPIEVRISIEEQAGPVQGENIEADPVQGEIIDADPVQGETIQADPVQGEIIEADPVQGEIIQADPVHGEVAEADPIQGEIIEADLLQRDNGDPVHSEAREVDQVQTFITDFIRQRKLLNSKCLELHTAAIAGDVKEVKTLIKKMEIPLKVEDKRRLMLCYPITESDETVLHIAAGAKDTRFVAEMLRYIQPDDLKFEDNNGNNPFCFAAMAGAKEIARLMLEKNPKLLTIHNEENMTPLYLAVIYGQRGMATFLLEQYRGSPMVDIKDIFFESLSSKFYDLASKLLILDNRSNKLAVTNYKEYGTALHMLARNPSAFTGKDQPGMVKRSLRIMKRLIGPGDNLINRRLELSTQASGLLSSLWDEIKYLKGENLGEYMETNKELIFEAAKLGNSNFLEALIKFYPDLVRMRDNEDQTIFHIALLHRHVTLFNLINNIGFNKQYIANHSDQRGNNLLHVAATYLDDPRPPVSMMPGAALRMQQELKSFKEVSLLLMPSIRENTNINSLTPQELFTKKHKNLLREGEEWMKKTSESCMLVATIITTVVYSAAFNVPGGYDSNGIPNFKKNLLFCGFTIADAVTLSSSSLSVLIFLSILTSRYEEEDFLKWLPLKLLLGIITLFISISTMMLSFSLSIFLAYSNVRISYQTIPILVCIFVFGPAISFVFLQLGLLKDIFISTFRPRFTLDAIDY